MSSKIETHGLVTLNLTMVR